MSAPSDPETRAEVLQVLLNVTSAEHGEVYNVALDGRDLTDDEAAAIDNATDEDQALAWSCIQVERELRARAWMLLEWRDAALAPVPSKRPLAAAAVARALDPRRPMSQQLRSGLEPEPLTSVKPAQVVYCADMLLGWTLPPPFDPWMGE